MANPSPYKARLGRKVRGKPGDLPALQGVLWYALKRAQGVRKPPRMMTPPCAPCMRLVSAPDSMPSSWKSVNSKPGLQPSKRRC